MGAAASVARPEGERESGCVEEVDTEGEEGEEDKEEEEEARHAACQASSNVGAMSGPPNMEGSVEDTTRRGRSPLEATPRAQGPDPLVFSGGKSGAGVGEVCTQGCRGRG